MKYYEVKFNILPYSTDACDLLAALAGEAGFESFETTEEGLTGYVQQQLFDRQQLDTLISSMPFTGVDVSYSVSEAEDRDWNEQWEQAGFDPIVVNDTLVIHDGRHLPTTPSSIAIEIDARQAFGTGTHETTRMVCGMLTDTELQGRRVLDCGCGSDILGIVAMKLGAQACVAYDIDEWSVDNTRHNAVINQVDITPLLGDASILLNKVEGTFDIVVANINRNILLNDMPVFRQKMAPGAQLILSGFYTSDIPMLTEKAACLGLTKKAQQHDGDWACLRFSM
jgi:ribosomal protein L11 methyltransferase